jgi:thioredoxin 1
VEELDGTTFDGAIGGGPLLVDFWAPWCRPCIALEPVLEQLSERIPVARVNIDDHPELSVRYSVLSVPTVMLFSGGEARGTLVGLRPLAHFERWLAEVLPAGEVDGLAVQGHGDA